MSAGTETVRRRPDVAWDASGWFGAQIGSTMWMLFVAVFLFPHSVAVGTAMVALFVAIHAAGSALWARREVMPARTGYRCLVLLIGLGCVAGTVTIHLTGYWEAVQIGGRVSPPAVYLLLAVMIPGMYWLVSRRAAG